MRGHGPGQEVLQIGKENVNITNIEQVGNYAVRLVFDDGHDSGIYSWDFLHELGRNQPANFASYLEQLENAGHKRQDDASGDPADNQGASGQGKVIKI